MEAIHVASWHDLKQLGINALTGESCAYGLRVLCDVNADGRSLVLDYLGLPLDTEMAKPWNSYFDEHTTVASVMLHRDCLRQIAEFGLFRMNVKAIVYRSTDALSGLFTDAMVTKYETLAADWPSTTKDWKWHIRRNHRVGPSVGSRAIHMVTGRTG